MTPSKESIAAMQPDERRALLAQLLREKARTSKTTLPLSYGQRAMWLLHHLAPESAAYNTGFAAHVRSALDIPALLRAFQTIIDRHEALRTSFVIGEAGPVQEIYGARDLVFEQIDASADGEEELRARVQAAYARPFDLAQGEVLRVHLFTRTPTDHVLLLVVHHIAIDGWSLGLILDEFQALYTATAASATIELPPPQPYSEFVRWQAAMLAEADGRRHHDYWHSKLGGQLPLLHLPADRPRPQQQAFHGTTHEFAIEEPLLQQLRALAKAERTTLSAVLLAAFYVLLHRYTGQSDIIVGTPMAARGGQAFQQTVGYMVSPVALRADLAGNPSFSGFLAQVRQTLLEALTHQDYPFALLVEQLRPPREPGRSPIFDVLFNLQQIRRLGKLASRMTSGDSSASGDGAALPMEPFPLSQEEGQFDLAFDAVEAERRLLVGLRYNTDLFSSSTIERMAANLRALLEAIVAEPEAPIGVLPLPAPAERQKLLVEWNATARDYPLRHCVHELIAQQAAAGPDAVAAAFEGRALTYGELDRRANQLAHHLQAHGVGPDVLVGVYLERSLDLLIAMLGVLKAGGAYVPLDPSFPRERLAYMLSDSGAPVLLTQAALAAQAPAHAAQVICIDADWEAVASRPGTCPASGVGPEHLAYVIYTSGSTGRPKGVQIPHRAVVNFLHAMREQPGIAPGDTLLAVTTLSFDIAVLELYLPLLVGARVVLVSRETAADGAELRAALEGSGATIMQATPVSWRMLLAAGWRPAQPLRALCGGELLPSDLARGLLEAGVELWNMYGPTETTVWSTAHRVERVPEGVVPVGRPIGNTQVYVLTPELQPAPIGVTGELYIGGLGVARGYHNRPELTAERFVASPFGGGGGDRLYRTGDLARALADGTFEVLGRADHQVKIRGFRIELGEIEAVLREHPGVREAAVIDADAPAGGRRLLAYLTAAEPAPTSSDLRRHLRARLPEYMVPALFITLGAIPLTPNGKLDRRALPLPERDRAGDEQLVAPTTETERLIAQLWCEALGLKRVGANQSFFDLGGHSLLAVDTMGRLEKQTGVKLHPHLIRTLTLGQLAAALDQQRAAPPSPAKEAEPPAGGVRQTFRRLFGARES